MSGTDIEALTPERAAGLLLVHDGQVHTFRQRGPVIVGCDIELEELLESMRQAGSVTLTGPMAQALGHGLAIVDDGGMLFIATHLPGGELTLLSEH
jgi:hypothetical protein